VSLGLGISRAEIARRKGMSEAALVKRITALETEIVAQLEQPPEG
jgi:hypothetical protein